MTEEKYMKPVRLNIAIADYGHTRALKSGEVPIKGVEANFVEVKPIIGAFRRMVREVEFDVCEMAPTTYMIARALGAPFVALPIVVMRRFHHGGFVVRPDSGIKVPKDLEGKKVGVRAYSVTTGVWTRGIFINEYDLDSSKVTWVVDDEEHVTTLKLPPNVVHAPEGKSLASMMANGELQAAFSGPAGIGRAGPPTGAWETGGQATTEVYPELIPDVAETEAEWFRRTGIYPIHGLIVVRTEVLWKSPWVARALYDAFVEAKKPYIAHLKGKDGDSADDKKYRGLMPIVGDPLPYGLKANMPSIEAMLTYGLQQKLIPKRMSLEEAFVDPEAK
jgi:4,5-dihydroxyphthalate decarboxylase